MKLSLIGLVVVLAVVGLTLPGVVLGQTFDSITPSSGALGANVSAVINGTGFTQNPSAFSFSILRFPGEISIVQNGTISLTTIPVMITISPTAVEETKTLTVVVAGVSGTVSFRVSDSGGGGGGGGAVPRERIPTNITSASQFIDLLDNIVDWIFVLLLIGAVIFIVLAGFQFITGGGDPQTLSQARTKLLWAAVGIAVAVLARGLVAAVRDLIGS